MGYYQQYGFAWSLKRGRRPRWKAAAERIRGWELADYDGSFADSESDEELHRRMAGALGELRQAMDDGLLVGEYALSGARVWVFAVIAYTSADETQFDDLFDSIREVFKSGALEAAGFETSTSVFLGG